MPLLGNAVFQKKFLRSHKIYLGMHSNERGECVYVPHRPKAEAFSNAVDIVERLRDPSSERTTPPRSAHVQLDDVPRALDPVENKGEFRQHDGMVTVMMMLPTQGFA